MTLAPAIPLADGDAIKILIGVAFALIWVIGQIVAASNKSKQRREQAAGALRPPQETFEAPAGDGGLVGQTDDPRRGAETELDRQLRERRERAERFRRGEPEPAPETAFEPPHESIYDEIRRQRQAMEQRQIEIERQQRLQQAPPRPKRKTKRPAKRQAPAAPAAQELASLAGMLAGPQRVDPPIALAPAAPAGAAERREVAAGARRLRAMLASNALRDVIVAAELVRPPLALREPAERA